MCTVAVVGAAGAGHALALVATDSVALVDRATEIRTLNTRPCKNTTRCPGVVRTHDLCAVAWTERARAAAVASVWHLC